MWIADDKEHDESSPGYVRHYYLDTSDTLGSEWAWDEHLRRLGHSYLLDFQDVAADLVTLGISAPLVSRRSAEKGAELFGYFEAQRLRARALEERVSNPTFSRMTELDGAWAARILARFDARMVSTLARMGQFADVSDTAYLAEVLEGRLDQDPQALFDAAVADHRRSCREWQSPLRRRSGADA